MRYLCEKMRNGVYSLASSVPSQRQRLVNAYLEAHAALFEEKDWPNDEDLVSYLSHLRDASQTVENPDPNQGRIDASVAAMSDVEVDRCVEIWLMADRRLNELKLASS